MMQMKAKLIMKIIMKTNTNKNLLMEENQQTVYGIDFEMERATYFRDNLNQTGE